MSIFTKNHTYQNAGRQSGFAVLYAVVIISLVTGLASVLLSTAARQTRLVTTSSQSTEALTAASTGLECAMYWDLQANAFTPGSDGDTITCAETNTTIQDRGMQGLGPKDGVRRHRKWTFAINTAEAPKCMNVTVRKYQSVGSKPPKTKISALGFDDCDNKDVARVLETAY